MSYYLDFSTAKAHCSNCKEPMKAHIDETISSSKDKKPSMLNKECWKNTSIFIGNCFRRYNMEDGTLRHHSCSDCCDDDEEDENDTLYL